MSPLPAAVLQYFEGEKLESLIFILPIGLLSAVFGAWLLAEGRSGFARGVAIPFVGMGLLMTVIGATVGFRTPGQVRRLEQAWARDATSAVAAETARMERVNRNWGPYLVAWAAFGVVGLGLRFGTSRDVTQGVGIALVFFSGVGLLVDGFAERRTYPYAEALKAAIAPPPAS